MKHKLLFGFATAAMAAVMCVGFAACGGGPNAKSVKGVEVTEEQWDKAFDYLTADDSVFTIEYKEERNSKSKGELLGVDMSGTYTRTATISAVKNGAKEYVKMTDAEKYKGKIVDTMEAAGQPTETNEEEERYSEYKDGAYTVYTKGDDGKWSTSTGVSGVVPLLEIASELDSLSYSAYEYSADQKGYVLKGSTEEDHPVVVKFNKDGQLVAIYCGYSEKHDEGGISGSVKYALNIVIDYDAKDVNLPSVG